MVLFVAPMLVVQLCRSVGDGGGRQFVSGGGGAGVVGELVSQAGRRSTRSGHSLTGAICEHSHSVMSASSNPRRQNRHVLASAGHI